MSSFKLKKSLNNNFVLSMRGAYGTKAIKEIATKEELLEARDWVKKFYEEPYKSAALNDLRETILKFENGAVVNEPANGCLYWYIAGYSTVEDGLYYNSDNHYDSMRLRNKNIFLTKEEAEQELYKRKVCNKLEKQITIINHDNNWVENWNNDWISKYFINYNHSTNTYDYASNSYNQNSSKYMCFQAAKWLLSDEVTDQERKIWINN